MNQLLRIVLLGTFLLPLSARGQNSDLDRLLKTLPEWMNTVAIIDVKGLNSSPRAKKEDWSKKHQTEYLSGAINIPPRASLVVLGGNIDPLNPGRTQMVGMMPVPQFVGMKELATREGGTMEEISGCTAVLSPRRGYIVQLPSHIVSGTQTLPRQSLARWLRFAKSSEATGLPKYLQEAVARKGDAQIMLALNMEEMVDPVSARLEVAAAGVGSEGVDGFVRLITNVRGLTFTATIQESTRGSLRIDFGTDIAPYKKSLTTFLLIMLGEYGTEIDEFKYAKPRFEGNSVFFDAELSDFSLRRILSIVAGPNGLSAASEAEDTPATPNTAAALTASLQYYRAVDSLIEDLKVTANKKKNSSDLIKSATWYETYAAKIDQLPIVQVDPEVLKYGASVASKFRALAGSLRGTKMQIDTFESYATQEIYATSSGWGRFANSSVTSQSNIPEIRAKQAEVSAKLEPERQKAWAVVEDDRQKIRRAMAEKYKIDFNAFK